MDNDVHPHWGMAKCAECGTFHEWVTNPNKKPPRIKRTKEDISACRTVRDTAKWCAFCGRKVDHYEAHHAWALRDGGPQAPDAVIVPLCHRCHLFAGCLQADARERGEYDA